MGRTQARVGQHCTVRLRKHELVKREALTTGVARSLQFGDVLVRDGEQPRMCKVVSVLSYGPGSCEYRPRCSTRFQSTQMLSQRVVSQRGVVFIDVATSAVCRLLHKMVGTQKHANVVAGQKSIQNDVNR